MGQRIGLAAIAAGGVFLVMLTMWPLVICVILALVLAAIFIGGEWIGDWG